MRRIRVLQVLMIAGGLLFYLLFWQEQPGLNTLFYEGFLLTAAFFLYPESHNRKPVQGMFILHLVSLAMLLLHNTAISIFTSWFTLILLMAFIQFPYRSVWFAGGSLAQNLLHLPGALFQLGLPVQLTRRWRLLSFIIFPSLLALFFVLLYGLANTAFSQLTNSFFSVLEKWWNGFLGKLSWPALFFTATGILLTAFLLLKNRTGYFHKLEQVQTNVLIRSRRPRNSGGLLSDLTLGLMGRFASGNLAIKNLNILGLVSLILLNALLALLNLLDIIYVWIGFQPDQVNLYEMIHSGTDLLILSIVLAILVVLLFFEGNLNFYKRNRWLKLAAYIWIAQNVVLAFSVLLRDYYYIRETGLAYKRIGVLFYLAMVFTGLISVFWKLYRRKTLFYLVNVNGWAGIILLVLATTVNWDEYIARYNFSRSDQIQLPVPFMLSLDQAALPLLREHANILEAQEAKYKTGDPSEIVPAIEQKIAAYQLARQSHSWLSWNWADARLQQQLTKPPAHE